MANHDSSTGGPDGEEGEQDLGSAQDARLALLGHVAQVVSQPVEGQKDPGGRPAFRGRLDGPQRIEDRHGADAIVFRPELQDACDRGIDVNALLTGDGSLDCGRVAHHPPLESELQELTGTLLVAVEGGEALIARPGVRRETIATVTRNTDLVLIARQFVWMELFTQRIYARLGSDLLDRLVHRSGVGRSPGFEERFRDLHVPVAHRSIQ